MAVGVYRGAGRQPLGAGRRDRFMADFRHRLAVYRKRDTVSGADHDGVRRKTSITLLSVGHACVDIYQGAVASLVPFFVAERAYSYAAVSGIVLAASLLSSVVQPVFGVLTDRWTMPWLLPVSTLLGGLGIALSGVGGPYALTLVFVAVSGVGVAAYHPSPRGSPGSPAGAATVGWAGSLWAATSALRRPAHGRRCCCYRGLRLTPLLVLPALVGAVLCLPVLRALEQQQSAGAGAAVWAGVDDRASFVKLSLAVVCRSIVFVGLSTFISLYAKERMGGSTAAGTAALFVLYLGGAVGSVLGGALADRWDRITVARWSYLLTAGSVAGVVFVPGPALYLCVALTSAGLYVPFSLQVTLGQDYLPSRVGTASGITLGLTVSIGGLASPLIGSLADATSLQAALSPLILMPALSWLLFRTLPEPVVPQPEPIVPQPGATAHPKGDDTDATLSHARPDHD
ncbi:MFS transporter [Streptomyces avermitilis]|uniref:MFS transporter n=1 Tax=Streptomyces avermitilis TaxID=33903 RepID=A0A4D4N772_STRAX|nr:MFS transporter [Streptomyces avermitilis]